jgi:hypothetical protein
MHKIAQHSCFQLLSPKFVPGMYTVEKHKAVWHKESVPYDTHLSYACLMVSIYRTHAAQTRVCTKEACCANYKHTCSYAKTRVPGGHAMEALSTMTMGPSPGLVFPYRVGWQLTHCPRDAAPQPLMMNNCRCECNAYSTTLGFGVRRARARGDLAGQEPLQDAHLLHNTAT